VCVVEQCGEEGEKKGGKMTCGTHHFEEPDIKSVGSPTF
jgi:hypothetical protein